MQRLEEMKQWMIHLHEVWACLDSINQTHAEPILDFINQTHYSIANKRRKL